MSGMFYNHWLSCKVHHNINNWNVSNVQDMSYMFGRAIFTHPVYFWINGM